MSFRKTATVTSIATSTFNGEGLQRLKKTALAEDSALSEAIDTASALASYYVDGASKLDVRAMLEKVADKYDISRDPTDYIFESIRANTVNVPNENFDAFHKSELLRFDTRVVSPFGKAGMPVYMTYAGKPHHMNHQASDPKRARGVILDSHYNDDSAPLEFCNTCSHRTAEVEGRDETGIHCIKCGSIAKDEFVEILVAVDTQKDPSLARGITAGILNAGSMGCFLPGTPITLADGTRCPIEDIRPGDRIITHTGKIAEVAETSVHEHDDDVYRIEVQGLQSPIVATGNHPFWTVDAETGKGTWTDADKLKEGQYLRCPATKYEPVNVENEFARLVGYFVSEGNYIKAYDGPHNGKRVGLEFSFASTEQHYVDEVVGLLKKYGNNPSVYHRTARNIIVVKDYRCLQLVERMFELVGQHAIDKTLSSEIMAWPRSAQMHFIGTWLNGDGYSIHDDNHSWSAITTSSGNLRDQLSQMLINLGIPHRIQNQPSGFGDRMAANVIISGNPQLVFIEFSDKIKRPHGIVSKIATLSDEHGLLRKVKSTVTEPYNGSVYNFEVNHADHSYVAGGVAVHNCNCASTTCNVCQHVARTTRDFCEHIRSGNKGSLWARKGNRFERTTLEKVKNLLKKAGYKEALDSRNIIPISLATTIGGEDFEIRRAFENCQGVEFDEYSRVHKPADSKARTIEILKAAEASNLSLQDETELLLLRARLASMEANKMSKAASAYQKFVVVRVNGNDEDIHVDASLDGALKSAQVGKRDTAEYVEIEASTPSQAVARALKTAQYLPVESDVQLVIPDGVQVSLDQNGMSAQPGMPGQQMPGAPGAPGQMQPSPTSIEDVTQTEMQPTDPQQSPEEFGMMPPGAEAPTAHATAPAGGNMTAPIAATAAPEPKFAQCYGDFDVEVFSDRADVRDALGKALITVNANKELTTNAEKFAFGKAIMNDVTDLGIVRASLKYKADITKLADSTDHAMFDMKGGRPSEGGGALVGTDSDIKGAERPSLKGVTVGESLKDFDDDIKGEARAKMPKNTIQDRDTDIKGGEASTVPPSVMATDDSDDDIKGEKRKDYSMKTDALQGADRDADVSYGGKKGSNEPQKTENTEVALDRQRKLNAARIEQMKTEHEAEKSALKAALIDQFSRALKVAAKRHALNIETSPLKATVVDSLTVARKVGMSQQTGEELVWRGMDTGLALHLAESAWNQAADEEINTLVQRAAELMTLDGNYLVDAEKDLAKQAAIIPQVGALDQLDPNDEVAQRAANMRTAAANGNFNIAPSAADDVREEKVSRIRAALSQTRVSRTQEDLRA